MFIHHLGLRAGGLLRVCWYTGEPTRCQVPADPLHPTHCLVAPCSSVLVGSVPLSCCLCTGDCRNGLWRFIVGALMCGCCRIVQSGALQHNSLQLVLFTQAIECMGLSGAPLAVASWREGTVCKWFWEGLSLGQECMAVDLALFRLFWPCSGVSVAPMNFMSACHTASGQRHAAVQQ